MKQPHSKTELTKKELITILEEIDSGQARQDRKDSPDAGIESGTSPITHIQSLVTEPQAFQAGTGDGGTSGACQRTWAAFINEF